MVKKQKQNRNFCSICKKEYQSTCLIYDYIGCENEITYSTWVHRTCVGWSVTKARTQMFICSKCENEELKV